MYIPTNNYMLHVFDELGGGKFVFNYMSRRTENGIPQLAIIPFLPLHMSWTGNSTHAYAFQAATFGTSFFRVSECGLYV